VRAAAILVLSFAFAPNAHAALPFTLELNAPPPATYHEQVTLRGRIVPALIGAPVTILRDGAPFATTTTGPDGTFSTRFRAEVPATYAAEAGELASPAVALAVRPRLSARVVGSGVVSRPLRLDARTEPAGPLHVEIWRDGRRTVTRTFAGSARIGLRSRRPSSFRIRVTALPPAGWAAAARTLRASVVQANLALGSRGPSVRELEQRLRDLHYALASVDGLYGLDTAQAVLAFQKVHGLARTGRVDARLWIRIAHTGTPRARFPGTHIEVSKGRQVLFAVRDGKVALVVHVSTGATGNTPLGTFHVYRKVVGWDWVLWYPMYFTGGFAIHGYPSVPAYPASHGCVRVPMWVAPRLFATNPWGETVYVYW
jgi:lipoprotein-anchoring transpeptidase ErfK/SrfK